MRQQNRNDFDQCVALIFELLYKTFPKEVDVSIGEWVEEFNDEMTDNYFATFRFLQREGLIRYKELHYETFIGVVLTAKGLKLLDTPKNVLQEEETLAQEISYALQDETEDNRLKRVIRKVINLSA